MKKNRTRFLFSLLLVLMMAPLQGGAVKTDVAQATVTSLLPGVIQHLNNFFGLGLLESQIVWFALTENTITLMFRDGQIIRAHLPG